MKLLVVGCCPPVLQQSYRLPWLSSSPPVLLGPVSNPPHCPGLAQPAILFTDTSQQSSSLSCFGPASNPPHCPALHCSGFAQPAILLTVLVWPSQQFSSLSWFGPASNPPHCPRLAQPAILLTVLVVQSMVSAFPYAIVTLLNYPVFELSTIYW